MRWPVLERSTGRELADGLRSIFFVENKGSVSLIGYRGMFTLRVGFWRKRPQRAKRTAMNMTPIVVPLGFFVNEVTFQRAHDQSHHPDVACETNVTAAAAGCDFTTS